MSSQVSSQSAEDQSTGNPSLLPTYVGRQPMFNANLETRAYELLYRSSIENWADIGDSDLATGQTFWNTFIELGQAHVAESQRAYINVTPTFLRSNCIEIFPKNKLALELRPQDLVDADVRHAIQQLRNDGYRIVLDGQGPETIDTDLFDLVDEIKIDVAVGGSPEKSASIVATANKAGITTIAKCIETFDCFEECRRAGFSIFQGHFLAKPQIVMGGRLPADGLARMRLLAAVNDSETGIEKMQEAISQDVGLSYKLLRYVNSAMFAFRTDVESIQHAVMILGMRWVRTWANLVILSGVTDKPEEIFNTAVIRGKMCELLSREIDHDQPEVFFTVGLLSTLPCLLDRSMEEILGELPVADELKDALLEQEGQLGKALNCTLKYERSAWDDITFGDLDPGTIRDSYLSALQWAADLRGTLE